jgi:hypothetical protein
LVLTAVTRKSGAKLLIYFWLAKEWAIFLLQFGISNACVIRSHEVFDKGLLRQFDILKGDGTVVVASLAELGVNDFIDKVGDAFLGVFLQTA